MNIHGAAIVACGVISGMYDLIRHIAPGHQA